MSKNSTVKTDPTASVRVRVRTRTWADILREWGLLILIVVMIITFGLLEPRFFSFDNVQNVLNQLAPLALFAAGQTVALIVGGVDISVGSISALSSVLMVYTVWARGTVPGIIVAILTGGVVGAVQGFIIARWQVNAFIVTLAGLTAVRGISLQVTGGIPLHSNIPASMLFIGNGYLGPIPVSLFSAIIGFIVLGVFLNLTPLGRYTYATGGNREAARLAGIKVKYVTAMAFIISGLFAGAAGAIMTSRGGIGSANMGTGRELDAIASAVIGGVAFGGGEGKVLGVIFGVLILSLIRNGLNMYNVSSFVQMIITGAIIAAAIVLDRYRHQIA